MAKKRGKAGRKKGRSDKPDTPAERKAPKLPPVRTGARPHSPAPPGRRGR